MADTIALMRQRVLEMAICGELVEQDDKDEHASELLKKIKNKKNELINKGLRKKATSIEKVSEDEELFPIPYNWKWARVNELVEINLGFTYKPEYHETGKLFLSVKDLTDTGINLTNAKYISEEEYEKASYGAKPTKGDVLFGRVGTLGKPRIIDFDNEFCIFVSLGFFRHYDSQNFSMKYLCYWMESKLFWTQVSENVKGSAQQNLNTGWLKNFLIPLPPINEQERIVAKIEEIFAVIDQIGTKKEEALSIIKNVRQAALRDAIMGVLVEQDENDEPASVLYEKIQAEKEKLIKEKKINKEKLLPEIEVNEIPFDIPESWKWVRLGDIVINRDGQRKPISMKERAHLDGEYPYYGASGIIDTINGWTHNGKFLLIGEDGANLISRSTPIAFMAEGKIWVNNHAHVLEETKGLKLEYLSSYINAIKLDAYVTGTAQPKLNQANLNKIVISLPPLAEQERIVSKLDEIMAICDQVEAIFDGTSEVSEDLKVV